MKHTALIVDDEQKSRIALRTELEDSCPNIRVIGEADGVEIAIRLIDKLRPTVVFLDIKMNDGTGFDLLASQPIPLPFQVIFVTAFDQYAIRAFKFSAVDYLLKPINRHELVDAVSRLDAIEQKRDFLRSLEVLLDNTTSRSPQKIVLNTSEGLHIHSTSEIIRIEADSNYSKIYFISDQPLTIARPLKEFDEMLQDAGFERTHQSHIVNISHVRKFLSKEGTILEMVNGEQVPVAQRKRAQIRNIIESL